MGTVKLLLGAAASLVLAGCAGGPPSTDQGSTPTASASTAPPTSPSTSPATDPATDPAADQLTDEPTDAAPSDSTGGAASSDNGTVGDEAGTKPDGGPGPSGNEPAGDSTVEEAAGLEMPVDGAGPGNSLSELLGERQSGPLVRRPLPRAASASARLVTGFPSVLRPTRSSVVRTSSLSPAGVRLQVGLVAFTSRSLEEVLLEYRRRLVAHGLVERDAPLTMPGSTAATFRRGHTVVTVTVTPEGPGATYIVQATLHAGRG